MELVFGIIALAMYFLPSLIAWNHNHNNLTIIVILNLFLGWTVAVWLGLFVWAFFFD